MIEDRIVSDAAERRRAGKWESPKRDFLADWRRWRRSERIIGAMIVCCALAVAALPFITAHPI
jgi:hypothetical protein